MGLPYAPPCCLIKEELYADDKKTAACPLADGRYAGHLVYGPSACFGRIGGARKCDGRRSRWKYAFTDD
jgi:hypothetical protein